MLPDVEHDFEFGRSYIPHLKQIAAELIQEAPYAEDTERATDLIVLRLNAVRIACRVRRHQYVGAYGDEFTIRCSRPTGVETELGKIVAGWGDYFIYGFAGEGFDLCAWLLADLRIFRLWFNRQLVSLPAGEQPGSLVTNSDGTQFRAFAISEMPDGFLRARKTFESQVAA